MSEPITIIGSNTVISGNLEGDEDLTVEGRVEGSINLSKTLAIESGGIVRANINVRNAVISGVLVGNIEAQEAVHVTEQGRVVGDIVSPRVILVDGASFRGNIDMGEFDIEREAYDSMAPPSYREEEEEEEEEVAKPAPPVRVKTKPIVSKPRVASPPPSRPKPVAAAPAPAAAAAPTKPVAKTPVPKPVTKPVAKKAPPTPKVRSVGKKTKAVKKKRK